MHKAANGQLKLTCGREKSFIPDSICGYHVRSYCRLTVVALTVYWWKTAG